MTDNATEVKAPAFKVKRLVSVPLLKFVDGRTVHVMIVSPIHKGKQINSAKEGAVMEPADLCRVVNLDTMSPAEIIVGAVLKGHLLESYPDGGYVNKAFAISQSKLEGKRYRGYEIAELELTKDQLTAAAQAVKVLAT